MVFEATWFVYLRASEESPYGIAFMSPDHPSEPPGPEAFNGDGHPSHAPGRGCGVRVRAPPARPVLAIDHPLRDEPWGQRRFGLHDPAGVWVDVVEQIEPAPGYWDEYTP